MVTKMESTSFPRPSEDQLFAQEDIAPSRKIKLSKFDSASLRTCWKDEEEKMAAEAMLQKMANAFSTIIDSLGDPLPDREGLAKTPIRAAKALCFFTKGYEEDLASEHSYGWKRSRAADEAETRPTKPCLHIVCPSWKSVHFQC